MSFISACLEGDLKQRKTVKIAEQYTSHLVLWRESIAIERPHLMSIGPVVDGAGTRI